MAQAKAEFRWDEANLALITEDVSQDILDALSAQGEALTKANITRNGQVDTGFMRNSVWSTGGSGGSGLAGSGSRAVTGSVGIGGSTAAFGGSAEYTIYQEVKNSFLYRALEQLKAESGGVIASFAK